MKFMTSYFYAVRFMKPHMIPLSTAMYNPKWFNNHGNAFLDRNNVFNGLRIEALVPNDSLEDLCRGQDGDTCDHNPSDCKFLTGYRDQLDSINFDEFLNGITKFISGVKKLQSHLFEGSIDEEPIIVFLFHEVPSNPCSERVEVTNWLRRHDQEVEEFDWRNEKYFK